MNKLYIFIFALILSTISARAQYVTVWKTDIPGTAFNTRIVIPSSGTNYSIKWEEVGNPANKGNTVGSGQYALILPKPGTYQVSIEPGSGTFNQIKFAGSGDRDKLFEIKQWGSTEWADMLRAYEGCSNLTISATDIPVLVNVTSMSQMFEYCTSLTTVPEMNNWDVSKVKDMSRMFYSASKFNEAIGDWSVSRVTNMNSMFYQARTFNQEIYDWNVRRVTNMSAMFTLATSFNQFLNSWDVSAVTDMSYMFYLAGKFNQSLNYWDVSQVRNMSQMFNTVSSFNQSLADWNLENAINMVGMLDNSGMDCASMALTLIGWASNPSTPNNITFGATNRNYGRDAMPALKTLQNDKGWTVKIGFETTCALPMRPFVTVWDTRELGISSDNEILIPANDVNYTIDWEEDGSPNTRGTASAFGHYTLSLPHPGTYRVRITTNKGVPFAMTFNNTDDKMKIWDVRQWGDIRWSTMENAFYGCELIALTAEDAPDLQNVSSLSRMFAGSGIGGINNTELWKLTNVTTTDFMFENAGRFDAPLAEWDVSNITSMQGMFAGATNFNSPIGNWNVGKVTNTSYMFNRATAFNQSLEAWDVKGVVNMEDMFHQATNYNQSLAKWNLSSVTDMSYMLSFSGLDCANMALTLQGWAANSATPNNIVLGAELITFGLPAAEALASLRNTKNWTIEIGAGVICSPLEVSLIHFDAKYIKGIVKIDWATASETNNDYFEVERSVNTRNWNAIGHTKGAGTVNSERNYSLADANPVEGVSYYRLKIVDMTGKADYSNIRAVNIKTGSVVSIYPNPATTSLTLSGKINGTIKIYNLAGQQLMQTEVKTEKTQISINGLAPGTYLIKSDNDWSSKFIKN